MLGLAYAEGGASAVPQNSDSEHPLGFASDLSLSAPSGCSEVIQTILRSACAQRLHAQDVDVEIAILAEIARLERADVGPAGGFLRKRAAAHCPAWHEVFELLNATTTSPLRQRAWTQIDRHGARLSGTQHALWTRLYHDLVALDAEINAPITAAAVDR